MHQDLVKVIEGRVVVDSREVAKNFGKAHGDVLKSVDVLVRENSLTKNMFYEDSREYRGQQFRYFVMNRDGFSLLVMGFTGSKALEWKIKYIQAFNAMEKALAERNMQGLKASSTPDGDALEDVVKAKAAILQLVTGIKDGMATLQALEYAERLHGISMEPLRGIMPPVEHNVGSYNPTQLGVHIGLKAQMVNKLLAERGWQKREGKVWRLTEIGKAYGEELPFKRNGHSDYRILWNEDALSELVANAEVK